MLSTCPYVEFPEICHISRGSVWRITKERVVSSKKCMLSSVSYVCLGVCSGMWVISRGIYLGVLDLSFISVLLFQRSGHFYLFVTF